MTFATAKFRSFLPAATFAMAAEFLMGMSDSVICGHVLGENGLSAVNIMQGVFEIVTFVGMLVALVLALVRTPTRGSRRCAAISSPIS